MSYDETTTETKEIPAVSHTHHKKSSVQEVNVNPKIQGFLISYIIFSLPGFITGLVWTIISFVILGLLLAGGSEAKPEANSLTLTKINDTSENNGVLVYDLAGAMTSSDDLSQVNRKDIINTNLVAKDFAKIKKDSRIKNIVFKVNTPGGEVYAAQVLGDLIIDLQKNYNKQAVFYFDRLSASGGLLASYKSPDNFIVASPYGETGSIGVMMTLPNFKGLADKVGYSETVIKSSESKDIGNPLRDLSKSEKEYLEKGVKEEFQKFKDIVKIGRKMEPAQVDAIANGMTFPNNEAREKGLVDQVGSIDQAITKAASNVNLGDKYAIYEIQGNGGFLDNLFSGPTAKFFNTVNQASSVLNQATALKPGTIYVVDDIRLGGF